MNTNKMQKLSRLLCLVGSAALVASLFVPLWRIDLDAPQYPEGLALQIYPHKLGGDVEIINGLNHYIGMRTLHAEDFIEFTVLPYIIIFFAALVLLAAVVGRKKLLYFVFGFFVLFGVVAMIDFWRWEYEYGHNLDPTRLSLCRAWPISHRSLDLSNCSILALIPFPTREGGCLLDAACFCWGL